MSEKYMKFNELNHPFPDGTIFELNKDKKRIIKIVNYNSKTKVYSFKELVESNSNKYGKIYTGDIEGWMTINYSNYVTNIILPQKFVQENFLINYYSSNNESNGVEFINNIMKHINLIHNDSEDIKMNSVEESKLVFNEIELAPEQFILKIYNMYLNFKNISEDKFIKEFSDLKTILYKDCNKLKSYVDDFQYDFKIEKGEAGNCVAFVPKVVHGLLAEKFVCYEYKTVASLIDSFDNYSYVKKMNLSLANEKNKGLKLGDTVFYFESTNENDSPLWVKDKLKQFAKDLLDGMPLANKKEIISNYVRNKIKFNTGYVTGIEYVGDKLYVMIINKDNDKYSKWESKHVFTADNISEAYDIYVNEIISKFLKN